MDRPSSIKPMNPLSSFAPSALVERTSSFFQITPARLPSTGPSNNQTNASLAATIIPDDLGATIVTSFNPPGYYLCLIATLEETAHCVLPYPLSGSY
ncbi:hypothetical protein GH714_008071 [Hevea brasiliensis]|uniref:Uncharacterized protein n=1 Tax=Hevea brasiliensis TaxID=3981 RepID=A0A6A6NA32_HEVBR|nr:hypothetical protein GH714_008071 [Hevea brasiliensis]